MRIIYKTMLMGGAAACVVGFTSCAGTDAVAEVSHLGGVGKKGVKTVEMELMGLV
ncbi:MAG: hypothetical protein ACSHX6_05385 [Akkermansiaceae bacterium]